jgi:hypothetical protein
LVPCGTPAVTGAQLEVNWLTFTDCIRPDKKLQIHRIKAFRTPRLISFEMTILWSIRSNALQKSRKQTRMYFPGLSR